jgi:hypothetical protein
MVQRIMAQFDAGFAALFPDADTGGQAETCALKSPSIAGRDL